MRVRPGLRAFLQEVSSYCDMYAFTSATPVYARPAFKLLDPKEEYFQKIWYRDSCDYSGKDLSRVFGKEYSAERTVLVDNEDRNFNDNPDNCIPIESFRVSASDRALTDLLPLIKSFSEVDDVRPVLADMFKMKKKLRKY
jgi:carboxy-terminal domain RNA polymerase II polypeptide A small phosphatase